MTTATPTRTLADVYRERLEAADPPDRLGTAIGDAIGEMTAPYFSTADLRPSEVEWLDVLQTTAGEAAKAAAFDAIVRTFEAELPKLLPSNQDGMAPPDLWAQSTDELREDAELSEAAR